MGHPGGDGNQILHCCNNKSKKRLLIHFELVMDANGLCFTNGDLPRTDAVNYYWKPVKLLKR